MELNWKAAKCNADRGFYTDIWAEVSMYQF